MDLLDCCEIDCFDSDVFLIQEKCWKMSSAYITIGVAVVVCCCLLFSLLSLPLFCFVFLRCLFCFVIHLNWLSMVDWDWLRFDQDSVEYYR